MKTSEPINVGRFAILSLLLIGILIASSGSASAQRRNRWDGYPNWGGSYQLRETALNAGYNQGSKEGRADRDKQRLRNYQEFSAYRDATKDYSSKLGDKELYRRYYRLAFESGYDTENPNDNRIVRPRDPNWNNVRRRGRDWNLYPTWGGSYELRQTALNAGYNEGIKQGSNDGRKGRHRNYDDFGAYRDATKDYSSKLGNKELYRRYYREGFQNGYEDGFRGY